MDEFVVEVQRLPKEFYVKDILYGADSLLDLPLRLGSKTAATPLRILLAHDGATLDVSVVDGDGEPVVSGNVFVIPEQALTATAVAARTVSGSLDQLGSHSFDPLPPGKYKVLAARDKFSRHPEMIAKLMRARAALDPIDLQPGATAQLTVTPSDLR